jgi:hypothetical protein
MLQGRLNQNSRTYIRSVSDKHDVKMSGSGLASIIKSSFEKYNQLYAGERHMPLILPSGKIELGSYIGPGTQVIKRLERDMPGKTPTDTVAKMHDINYTLAQNSDTVKEQLGKIREADVRMVNKLKKIQREDGDNPINIQAGMRIIQSKLIAENMGLLNKSRFAGPLEKHSEKDVELLESNKQKLTQQGYGTPADGLKKMILRDQKRKSLTNKYAGKGFDVSKFITKDILPVITDKLNIDRKHIDINKIQDMIKKFKVKTIPDIVKVVLPHLVVGNMKTKGLTGGTSGLKPGFQILPDFIAKNLGKLFMHLIKQRIKKGSSGSGLIQDLFSGPKAQKFWGSFATGFKKGFTGVAKLAEPILGIASTVMPELLPVSLGVSALNRLT